MSMKNSGPNLAWMSQTSKTLPLMSPALKKIIRKGGNRQGDNVREGLKNHDGGLQLHRS